MRNAAAAIQIAGIVVNLTGRRSLLAGHDFRETGLRTQLAILDCNMAEKDAQIVLDGIAAANHLGVSTAVGSADAWRRRIGYY